jgi:hypothetical protein
VQIGILAAVAAIHIPVVEGYQSVADYDDFDFKFVFYGGRGVGVFQCLISFPSLIDALVCTYNGELVFRMAV